MNPRSLSPLAALEAATRLAADGKEMVSSADIAEATGASLTAVKRVLAQLVSDGELDVQGKAVE